MNAACRASSVPLAKQLPGPPGPQLPPTARGLTTPIPETQGLPEKRRSLHRALPCWFSMGSLRALSRFSRVQLCVTLWSAAHQALLSMGFCRQEYWSGRPFPPPRGTLSPGIKHLSLTSNLHWQWGSLPRAPPGKPQCTACEIVTASC